MSRRVCERADVFVNGLPYLVEPPRCLEGAARGLKHIARLQPRADEDIPIERIVFAVGGPQYVLALRKTSAVHGHIDEFGPIVARRDGFW